MVAAVYRELKRRGRGAQRLIRSLLYSPELGLRAWAASHALEFAPDEGVPVLEALSKEPKWLGFSAQMTLKIWRDGKLTFP